MRSSVQVQQPSRGRTRAVEWDVARSKVRGQTDGDQLTFSGRGLSERSRLGNGSQLAIVRAYSRACSVLAMPGNNRRSSTAAENSPRWRKIMRIAAACASVTTNIARACGEDFGASRDCVTNVGRDSTTLGLLGASPVRLVCNWHGLGASPAVAERLLISRPAGDTKPQQPPYAFPAASSVPAVLVVERCPAATCGHGSFSARPRVDLNQ
jgi:hypothetical protein